MATSSPQSPQNVQWGFEVGDTAMVTITSDVGFIDGAIVVRAPRTTAWLRADMYAVPIDATVTTKDVMVTFTMKEVLGESLVHAWGAGDYAGSSIIINTTDQGAKSLVIVTKGPDGSTCTATLGKAHSIGDGTWTIPFAAGQTIEAEFQGAGDMASSGKIFQVVHS